MDALDKKTRSSYTAGVMEDASMNQEDAANLIRQKLVEPPGMVDADLIGACEGLIGLDEVGKRVNIKTTGLADKERVVLYLLGMRLLAYLLKEPLAEVECKHLATELDLEAKTVA